MRSPVRPHRLILGLLLPLALLLAGCGLTAGGSSPAAPPADSGLVLTDVAGRRVTLPKRPERIVMGESRAVYATLILNKEDPLRGVVAWGTDLQRAAPDISARVHQHFPKAKDLPTIGSVYANDLSVEGLLAHHPDVLLFTLDAFRGAEKNGLVGQLDRAGLPFVVTDFRLDPLKNTAPSIRLLGAILGREAKAEEFLAWYAKQTDTVTTRGAQVNPRPSVFLWRAPGLAACCSTYGRANFGGMIDAAGGRNIGTGLLPGDEGVLTPEQVLAAAPESVIATGGEWGGQKLNEKAKTSYVRLSYDADPASARASVAALRAQPGFEHLGAYSSGRVHAIYHQFYDSPFNFVALQAFARWSQPQTFADLDPQRTWEEFHERFMPFRAEGTFLVSLGEGR
ncbi:ABC transporter substrate-binding protein [Mariniluteicoccus flavus]